MVGARLSLSAAVFSAFLGVVGGPCSSPAESSGYAVQEVELEPDAFDVEVACDASAGYTGTASAAACETDEAPYVLSGCAVEAGGASTGGDGSDAGGGLSAAGPCGSGAQFTSIRFVPTATREGLAPQGSGSVDACASRVVLYSGGGAAPTTDDEVLVLNITQFGTTAELPSPSRITFYDWATAGPSAGHGCDPVRWRVEGSADGSTWALLDDRSASPVCVGEQREVLQGPFETACSALALKRARFVRVANEGPDSRRLTIGDIEVLPRRAAPSGWRFEVKWAGVYSARTQRGDVDTVTVFSPHPGVVEAYSESGQWAGRRLYDAYLASLSDRSETGEFDSATQTIQFVARDTQEATAAWTRSKGLAEFNLVAKGRLCEPAASSLFLVSWGRWCTGTAAELPASCTGVADDAALTCDLDSSTDETGDCPAGCTFTDAFTPECESHIWSDELPSGGCPAGCSETAVQVVNGQQMCESRCAAEDACSYYIWQPGNGTSISTCSGYNACEPITEDSSDGGLGTVAYRRGQRSWKPVVRQSIGQADHSNYPLSPAFLSQEQWRSFNPENPESHLYSDAENMERFRSADGKFYFRLIASCDQESSAQDSDTHGSAQVQDSCASQGIDDFVWTQTSNPMLHDLSSVEGFEPVSVWSRLFDARSTGRFATVERHDVVFPSGTACCGQPAIQMDCPAGTVITSGSIVGTCCSADCPVAESSCSCASCDTGQDEEWSGSMVCATEGGPLDYADNFAGLRSSMASSCAEPCDKVTWMMEGLDGNGDVLLTLGQSRPYRKAAIDHCGRQDAIPIARAECSSQFDPGWACAQSFDCREHNAWATQNEGEGARVQFTFQGGEFVLTGMSLKQRNNDLFHEVRLDFSDGTNQVISLEQSGAWVTYALIPVLTSSVELTVLSVLGSPNPGMHEIWFASDPAAAAKAFPDATPEGLRGPGRVVTNLELYAMIADESHANHLPPQGLWHHLDCQGADVWPCWEDGDSTKNATTGCVHNFHGCPSRLAVATVVTEHPTDDACLRARWQYECLAGTSCIGSLAGEWVTADEQLAEASVSDNECADVIAFAASGITCLHLAQQLSLSDLEMICGTAADRTEAGNWTTMFPQFSACECLCSAAADPANAQKVDYAFSMTQSGSLAMLHESAPRLYGVRRCIDDSCDSSEELLQTGSTTVHISGRTVRRRVPARTGTLSANWTMIIWDDGSVSTRIMSECTRVGPAIDDLAPSSTTGETYDQALHGLNEFSTPMDQEMSVLLNSQFSRFYEVDLGCEADIAAVRLWNGGYEGCCDAESNANEVSISLYSSEAGAYNRVAVARQVAKFLAPSGYFMSATFDARFDPSTTACPAEANCYQCALNHADSVSICLSCLEGFNLVDVDERSVGRCVAQCENTQQPLRSCESQATCAVTTCEVLGWQPSLSVHVHDARFAAQHTTMSDGVSAWYDSDATTCVRVPAAIEGGMFFQSSTKGLEHGSDLHISSGSGAAGTIYVFTTILENGWPLVGNDGWSEEGAGPYLSTDARAEDVPPLGWQSCEARACAEVCGAEDWRFLNTLEGRQVFAQCREGMCWHGYEDVDRCDGMPENFDLGHNLVCIDGRNVMQRCVRSQYGETRMWSRVFSADEVVRLPETTIPLTLAGVVIQPDNASAASTTHCVSVEKDTPTGVTFEEATEFCRAQGARLCQVSELTQDPADFLEAFDAPPVWTASSSAIRTCPRGYTICEQCCDMDNDCRCDDACRSASGLQNGTDEALPCVLPRPHLQALQCAASARVTLEINGDMGARSPLCVDESETARASKYGDVELGFQCCADVNVAACQQSCEVSCDATSTNPATPDVPVVAMSVAGLLHKTALLEAIGIALVWPCEPSEIIGSIQGSIRTKIQHVMDVDLTINGSPGDYPADGPETTCGEAVARGSGAEGAPCGSRSDCQSGNCDGDVCGSEIPAGDSEYGTGCESDSDCASALCTASPARMLRMSVASALRSSIDVDCLYTVELKATAVATAVDRVALSLRVLLQKIGPNQAQFSQSELDEIERQVLVGNVGSEIDQTLGRNAAAQVVDRRTEIEYANVALSSKRQSIFSAALAQRMSSLQGFHSCSDIPPGYPTGVYTIVPTCGADPQQVYCDLDTDSGGWNLVASSWRQAIEFNSLGAYYDDLQTIAPETGHSGVWDALLQRHAAGGDLRVSCSTNARSGNTTFDIDAIARDVDWYSQIVARSPRYGSAAAATLASAASCIDANDGQACTGITGLEAAMQYRDVRRNESDVVDCYRDNWPKSRRPVVCGSLNGITDDIYEENDGKLLWGMDAAVALDPFHISFQACASLVNGIEGGQMLLWYRNRPATAAPIITLSATSGSLVATGAAWNISEVIEPPASASIGYIQQSAGIRLEQFSLPLLPSGSDWTVTWNMTIPNGLSVERNGAVPTSLRALMSAMPPGWHRASMTWGQSQPLRFSVNRQSWQYYGDDAPNSVAQSIFDAQRDVEEDPLFTDLRIFAAVFQLRDLDLVSLEPSEIGHDIVAATSDDIESVGAVQMLDRALAFERPGWVTAWSACVQEETSQSKLNAQVWRPLGQNESSARLSCVEIDAGEVAVVAGTFLPHGTAGVPTVVQLGDVLPVAGTYCVSAVPTGCQPRDFDSCESYSEETDCPQTHCEWTPGGCQENTDLAVCQTFEKYSDCPHDRCQYLEEYALVCTSEITMPGVCPEGYNVCATCCDRDEDCNCDFDCADHAESCSVLREEVGSTLEEMAICPIGRWHRSEIPYNEQCEVKAGDVVGWHSQAQTRLIEARNVQQADDQQGGSKLLVSTSPAEPVTDGRMLTFASATPSANLAYALSATVRSATKSNPWGSEPALSETYTWSGAASVYQYTIGDTASTCEGRGSQLETLTHVERLDEASVCETFEVAQGVYLYQKKTCTSISGLQAWRSCSDATCSICDDVANLAVATKMHEAEASTHTCFVRSDCLATGAPGVSVAHPGLSNAASVYPQCFNEFAEAQLVERRLGQCAHGDNDAIPPPPPPPIVVLRDCDEYSQSYCDTRCQACHTYNSIESCERTGRCTWQTGDQESCGEREEDQIVDEPDCAQRCVGFKHCLTCQPMTGAEDVDGACPAALPNFCAETDCSNILDDDDLPYVLCNDVCVPQDVCAVAGNRTIGEACSSASQCATGACAENPDDCPPGCIAFPLRHCESHSLTPDECASWAQLMQMCPAEFAVCETARARCRPTPCEPVSCMSEMRAFYDGLSDIRTDAGTAASAYDPFGTSDYFWQDEVISIHECLLRFIAGG